MPNTLVRASATALPKIQDMPAPITEGLTEKEFIDHLAYLPDRYGMLVVGGCLAPEIKDGETILVDKTAPYAAGDLVVIYRTRDATPSGRFQGIVKRLVAAPPPWVTKFPHKDHPESEVAALIIVEMINPRRQFVYRCRDIIDIHKCLGVMPAPIERLRTPSPEGVRLSAAYGEA